MNFVPTATLVPSSHKLGLILLVGNVGATRRSGLTLKCVSELSQALPLAFPMVHGVLSEQNATRA